MKIIDTENVQIENINQAIAHFNNATQQELFGFLKGDDEVLQQLALLKINNVNSAQEVDIIIQTLTNHSSETREYCSFLLNRLFKNADSQKFFTSDIVLNTIEQSIFDVNPKVCRNIVEILLCYINLDKLYPKLIKNSFKLITLLEEKNKNRNYLYNKISFQLYWHIFALAYAINVDFAEQYSKDLILLTEQILSFKEYTLREKGALLIQKLSKFITNDTIIKICNTYANDENFYVKNV